MAGGNGGNGGNGGPECEWCEQLQRYDCGPPPRCEGPTPRGAWTLVGTYQLQEGITYYVKCQPGCEAVIEDEPDLPEGWMLTGQITPGTTGHGPAGTYKLFCKTYGGGEKCRTRLDYVPE